jgi:hypothetical protein
MPTRKQRRRQQKGRRHEYEFVYVDDEGQEVAVDEPEPATRRRDGSKNGKVKNTSARASKAIRKVDPPSWKRVIKRSLIFAPLIFLAFGILNHTYSLAGRVALTLVYTAFFVPFMYLMDRALYRAYLRRSGNAPPARAGKRR